MEARRDQARSNGERWRPWQLKFHWQLFLSKGVWQRRSEEYIQYMGLSDAYVTGVDKRQLARDAVKFMHVLPLRDLRPPWLEFYFL